ncbi:2-succinyl-5-enolpyruvyl-6-hydroxy-3-cyclohexene-1-carboxylic-acid synthase [Flavobacterium sp. GT3R68]|uniref:2-succinyl-5-enolpyruvyl-6-hydroxy-3- cyclohexene-1-carboxylic-acid synthase n=1 Tax=Flavobacterium sp. GT3R68 TaxID=2594437 RepID=UPI000F890A27|nr:2-succinyl-5-enolpyruvyl-6-hydroxy-3-cyclohexene-1-carboxylic-acid synthase [Flavobacterium sp. GT3R68]RTY95114.1 2-succinyl-5-enolpyruvyl-6-hydroxy-3-cyclohexene-1-carboxylic-acid synthase [Flavobacterium sp. GSN2]TRW91818.1 2-succinyl-5-enolpyruvyl-6-hydroxy-3-cyclohexene-1-carboxylic-acid synthase [Flavobacterium sp. GT3R68]
MIYPKIPLAQSIIQICLTKGIHHIVISPGSRNAPLTIGFVNNPEFHCYSIADERCAAFFALGIAQQVKKPVAVVCTSGSALLNYYPAFAEAFYSQIPLIVISADRPHDKIDIGDGQTIRQENVFVNHSLYNANLTEEASPENDVKINEAINKAVAKKGPVHINAPFEEPLYQKTEQLSVDPLILPFDKTFDTVSADEIIAHTNIWNKSIKKLVLVGVNDPDTVNPEIIEKLANDNSVVVMTETTSNLHHPSFINNIDTIITPFSDEDFKQLNPDILITFGGMVVSKRIKAFLRKYKPRHHWHIDSLRAYDTFGCLTKHFEDNPNSFFSQFLPFTNEIESDYRNSLQRIVKLRKEKHQVYAAKAPFSDFKVFEKIMPSIPKGSSLHLSNSSAIRYVQLFNLDPSVEVFCNRGTSGIDGSTSTAVGSAVAKEKQTILITGDISFLYDSNAIWNEYIPRNFKIILINNGGGGIFRILPGHEENIVFNKFFETSHCLTGEQLAKMYGFKYSTASDEISLENSLGAFYQENNKPQILEIFTPTLTNDKILLQYFNELV